MNAALLLEIAGFVWKLLELFLQSRYSVTSWFRTPEHNASVGGSPSSLHLRGLAVDVVPGDGVSRDALLAHAVRVGLHGVVEADHVHLQARAKA